MKKYQKSATKISREGEASLDQIRTARRQDRPFWGRYRHDKLSVDREIDRRATAKAV
jgi:hypothetical protein